jgi:hypothetical protein
MGLVDIPQGMFLVIRQVAEAVVITITNFLQHYRLVDA